MDGWTWLVALLGLVVAAGALWRCARLAKQLQQLTRNQYYTESRVKRVSEEIREAVQPLRWQLASVVAGKPVPRESILDGRLYVDVSAEEARRMLEADGRGTVSVVDVRTPKEYAAKHISGARLLPFEELDRRHRDELSDAVEKIVVYCSAGDRSRLACDFLARQGYTNVYNVQDGLQGWRGPVEGEGELTFIRLEGKR